MRLANFSLSILLLAGRPLGAAEEAVETKTFPAQLGDSVVIRNDYGRIQVRGWDQDQVQARVRRIAGDSRQLEKVAVAAQKNGTRIYLHAYFYDYASESVYLELNVPHYLNVLVSGANPAVEIYGVGGQVRIDTLTGLIMAEDLTSHVSLFTEAGDIFYRLHVQPAGDARLESSHGNIRCELKEQVNLRGWARAGGRLSWNQEVEINQGFLEKQVGIGGPLLYANSLRGNVELQFLGSSQSPSSHVSPAPQGPPAREEAPLPAPAAQTQPEPAPGNGGRVEPSSDGTVVSSGYSLKVNVDWIYLNVSVRDRSTNRSIPDLQKDDFLVYENDLLQTVEKFESQEAPFSLLLLLDVSGSTREFIDLIRQASIQFTHEIKASDRIAVAVFNSRVRLIQPFSNDRREVSAAIGRIRSGGGTAFYDALSTCIQDYMSGFEGRKAIVVFTDGVDNQLTGDYSSGSTTTFQELYRDIQEIDSIIYTIFLDTEGHSGGPPRRGRQGGSVADILEDIIRGRTPPPLPLPGTRTDPAYAEARRQLEMIAEQTGGRMYSPRYIDDLAHVYSEIADDLRIQYTLAYSSTNPARDGSWRSIKVRIRNRHDAVARTRKGYYAGSRNMRT